MTTEINGSHLKANNSYGQNGDASASSLTPGQSKPNIPKLSLPSASAAPGNWQTRDVDATPIPTHPGLVSRSADGLSGNVPDALSHK